MTSICRPLLFMRLTSTALSPFNSNFLITNPLFNSMALPQASIFELPNDLLSSRIFAHLYSILMPTIHDEISSF